MATKLNLGCGTNPMRGAVNLDIEPKRGVDVVADVARLPFADSTFDEVHAVNPHDYQPVAKETARVLKVGGRLYVTGNNRNGDARPLPSPDAEARGFEALETGPMIAAHHFGVQRTRSGRRLDPASSLTTTYGRLP